MNQPTAAAKLLSCGAHFIVGGRKNNEKSHLELAVNLGASPVPDVHLSLPVPRGQELAVRTERHPAGVPCVHVALKFFLLHLSELVAGRPGDDLVVQRLANEEAPSRMQRRRRHRVHVWLRDVFDGYRNVVLPNQYLVGLGHGDGV